MQILRHPRHRAACEIKAIAEIGQQVGLPPDQVRKGVFRPASQGRDQARQVGAELGVAVVFAPYPSLSTEEMLLLVLRANLDTCCAALLCLVSGISGWFVLDGMRLVRCDEGGGSFCA